MRKLGLDVGSKSCGIAISDPYNLFAIGLDNFFFNQEDWFELVKKIKEVLNHYEVDTIVIGFPTFGSGDLTNTGSLIQDFVKVLKHSIKLPIIFINENYSTKTARKIMQQGNLNTKKQKNIKDKLAAQLILEDYLMRLPHNKL